MQTASQNSKSYSDLLQSENWLKRRNQILERDAYRCARCFSTENLNVHHRQYHINAGTGEFKKPWEYEGYNLVTLCSKCHNRGHQLYKVPVFNV